MASRTRWYTAPGLVSMGAIGCAMGCIGGAIGCIVLAGLAATADHDSGVPLDGGLEAVAIAGSGVEATEECCPLQVP